jgi:hypothetical protein
MRRRAQVVRDESGLALIMAVGMVLVLSVAVVAALEFSAATSRSSDLQKRNDTAFALAEAGVNSAFARLSQAVDPNDPTTLPSSGSPQTLTFETGTVEYWGSYSSGVWTITARSSVQNPTGAGPIQRTVSQKARANSVADNPAWGSMFSDSPSGCMSMTSSVQVRAPLYVRSNLCLSAFASIASTASPLNVGGTIEVTASATVGTAAARIPVVNVGGGCRVGSSGAFTSPCGDAERVFVVTPPAGTSVPSISKPPLDLDSWWANAKPGPKQACTSSSGTVPLFDNDAGITSAPNRSAPTVNLLGPAYSCTVTVGSTTVGELTWVPGSPGTLTITGAVFFDGDIYLPSGQSVVVSGRGTIYASGTITFTGTTRICGAWDAAAGDCDWTTGVWNPNVNLLLLVAGAPPVGSPSYGFQLTSSTRFQGAVYAAADYSQSSTSKQQGPIIVRQLYLSSSSQAVWSSIVSMPPGAPVDDPIVGVPGSWSG